MSREVIMGEFETLKDKSLALFFTCGVSLATWHELGMIDREVAIYNEFSKYFKHIYLFTYGGEEDLEFKSYLAENITIIPKKYISNNLSYSLSIPLIHRRILKDVAILKTNQMWGSWSAVLTKLIYRKQLVVRTGYMLSINFVKANPKNWQKWLVRAVERVAYKLATGIITTSQTNYEYVERNYRPRSTHILIANYVETDVFRPINLEKKKGTMCFIGRLTREKNLLALLEALKGLPYTLTMIGSGEQREDLEKFADESEINVNFLGNIPNHELPQILNQHQLFILPSLWEGMPKTLLEAMSCGLPVIGTNIDGSREVIEHGKNGILCDTDSPSIREAIIALMQDKELKPRLGQNARTTIVENYSLDKLARKELRFMGELL